MHTEEPTDIPRQVLLVEIVETLVAAIDARDSYTRGHSFRVAQYAVLLAQELGLPEGEVDELRIEGLLHDVGKIGIPDALLNKPGRLTYGEREALAEHTIIGSEILMPTRDLRSAAVVARSHHERFDGRGYPDGLVGTEIPLHARIVAVCDAYDAMCSDRVYRQALGLARVRGELMAGRGTQFDPTCLDAFVNLLDRGALAQVVRR